MYTYKFISEGMFKIKLRYYQCWPHIDDKVTCNVKPGALDDNFVKSYFEEVNEDKAMTLPQIAASRFSS